MSRISALAAPALLAILPAPALAQDAIFENWTKVDFEEVRFPTSGDVEIAGALYMPVEEPRAALVLVHGSNAVGRMDDYARLFATKGFAALTYDRRGHGGSGGALPGAHTVSPENLALMADDAAAAMQWLAARPEAERLATGYFGIGQAGWIVPPATARAPETDFMVMWSATAMSVAAELEDGLSRGEDSAVAEDLTTLAAQLRAEGTDLNPAPDIAAFGKPSLWIYGTEDAMIPVDLALAVLQPMAADTNPEITIVINDGGRHDLDLEQDRALFEGMVEWMQAQPSSP